MNEHKLDIFNLPETRKKDEGITKLNNNILVCSVVANEVRTTSGEMILVHQIYQENIETIL